MGSPTKSLRAKKLHTSQKGTASITRRGALLLETAQRPDPKDGECEIVITLTSKDYRLLEVLHDDVAAYIQRLIVSHCEGRRKSIRYNKQQKETK